MIRLDALKAATDDFLASSLVGDGFELALSRIGEAADRSAVVLSLDDGMQMKASMQTADVAAGVLAFAAGKSPPNPRTVRCAPGLREGFRTDQDDFSWEEIARLPWYQEFLRSHVALSHSSGIKAEGPLRVDCGRSRTARIGAPIDRL